MSQVDKDVSVDRPLLPLPIGGMSHAVVFFDAMPKNLMTEFTRRLSADYPHLESLNPARWGAATEPRMISFGELVAPLGNYEQKAEWHILIDSEGVAPDVKRAITDGPGAKDERLLSKLDEAGASVLVFLLEDGWRPSTPISKLHALCHPVWSLLELGAVGVAFPEGHTMITAQTLLLLHPEDLTAHHSYLFISSGLAHRDDAHLWFRTFGMAQFGLPDLCHAVPTNLKEKLEEALTQTRLLFETLPPEMIAQGGILPLGGEVKVGDRTFRAALMPEGAPDFSSRRGFCYLE